MDYFQGTDGVAGENIGGLVGPRWLDLIACPIRYPFVSSQKTV